MNLTLHLSAELEANLREKAKATGKTLEGLAIQVLEEQLDMERQPVADLSRDEWVAEFRAWARSHRHLPHEADDSRESIYSGRGE